MTMSDPLDDYARIERAKSDRELEAAMHERDAAATTAHGMASVMEAMTQLAKRLTRIEALLDQIALGLGVDISKT
jgi:hypothetical protein